MTLPRTDRDRLFEDTLVKTFWYGALLPPFCGEVDGRLWRLGAGYIARSY